MRTTVCCRKTEITMRVGTILTGHPCYCILETGKKKDEQRKRNSNLLRGSWRPSHPL